MQNKPALSEILSKAKGRQPAKGPVMHTMSPPAMHRKGKGTHPQVEAIKDKVKGFMKHPEPDKKSDNDADDHPAAKMMKKMKSDVMEKAGKFVGR